MIRLLVLFLIAVLCGGFGSLLGLGGGVFLVPLLTVALHVPIKTAVAASLITVIASSTAASGVYVESGLTHVRLAMLLEIATTIGALTGSLLATRVTARWLEALFGVVMLLVAYSMARRARGVEAPVGVTGSLDTVYEDQASGETVRYGVRHMPAGLAASFAAGGISGLLGIGGGAVKVPLMHVVMGVPMKAAIATSNFMIGVTAATGALIYYQHGLIRPDVAAPTALGVLAGAQLGARVARKAHGHHLRWLFLAVLVVLALQMLWKAWS